VRTVILLLVVANLVFFGWAHWVDVPAQAKAPSAAPLAVLATATGATRCKSLGPFVAADTATHAAAALLARGIATQTRQASRTVPDGFLVYVGGFANNADEQKALQRLGRAGISDAIGVSEPGQEARIIVGVMASEDQANERVELVQKSGFKAQTEARQRQENVSWVDAKLGPQVPLPTVADLISGPDAAAATWGECVAAPAPHG
jgi:cell division septation protein DedD